MNASQQIPPYQDKVHGKKQRDVVRSELNTQFKRLKAAKKRNHRLEKQYKKENERRKQAEHKLQLERVSAAKETVRIRIQTKLDDWAFYCSGGERDDL